MKRFLGLSPPFIAFLIENVNTGRKMIFENCNMGGAGKERADSG
jgi:hypothetical protein